jgi:hypothetical protein
MAYASIQEAFCSGTTLFEVFGRPAQQEVN